jgi:hypothetical protein
MTRNAWIWVKKHTRATKGDRPTTPYSSGDEGGGNLGRKGLADARSRFVSYPLEQRRAELRVLEPQAVPHRTTRFHSQCESSMRIGGAAQAKVQDTRTHRHRHKENKVHSMDGGDNPKQLARAAQMQQNLLQRRRT